MARWNPWHGCHKLSEGCRNCYVYRIDGQHGRDSSDVRKTADFDLPVRMGRGRRYKIAAGETVYTCFSSDFFVEEADEWRPEAWEMIRRRSDLRFFLITKRIDRLAGCVPDDWGNGYSHVTLGCTIETQDRADYRMPIYRDAPIRHKIVICEPLLEAVDLSPWLGSWCEEVIVGGESGPEARVCRWQWVIDLRRQCMERGVAFRFKQTGALFERDGKLYRIPRRLQQSQAGKAGIDLF